MFFKKNLEKKLKTQLEETKERQENMGHLSGIKKINMGSDRDKLNYPLENECFGHDDVRPEAKEAKSYLKNLLDPDILEQKQKPWNVSVLPNLKEKPDFKTTLFEVRNGLKDFKVLKLKDQKVELGADSRNACYFGWNCSNYFDRLENKKTMQIMDDKCRKNTMYYWKKNNNGTNIDENILNNSYDDLKSAKNDKKENSSRYVNPMQQTTNYNLKMRESKKDTSIMRANVRKEMEQKYASNCPESIDVLIFKEVNDRIRLKEIDKKEKEQREREMNRTSMPRKETELDMDNQQAIIDKIKTMTEFDTRNRQSKPRHHKSKSENVKGFQKWEIWHPGKYVKFEFEKSEVWSCCMNSDKNDKGCAKKKNNLYL